MKMKMKILNLAFLQTSAFHFCYHQLLGLSQRAQNRQSLGMHLVGLIDPCPDVEDVDPAFGKKTPV